MISFFRVIAASYRAQLADSISSESLQFTLSVQPVLFAIISVALYRFNGKPDLAMYGLIGSGLIGMWNANLWTSGFIVQNERRGGTLELLIAAPTSLMTVLFGRSLSNAVLSIVSIFVTLVAGALIFQIPLGIRDIPSFIISLLLTVLALSTLGLIFGTAFVLTRRAGMMAQVMNYPIFILSGLTFPITTLPLWTRPLSVMLAPTWGSDALAQAAGISEGTIWVAYLWLIGLAVIYYLIALGVYRRIEHLARAWGGMDLS